MGKFAKVLVFLQFFLVLGFLFFSLKTTAKINSQRLLIRSLQQGVTEQGESIQSLQGVLGSASASVGGLRTDKNNLTTELGQTKTALSNEQDARAVAETAQQSAETAQQVAETAQQAAETAHKETQGKLDTANSENARMTRELKTAQGKVASLTTELDAANGNIAALTKAKATLQDRLTVEMAKTDPGIASKRIAELNGEVAAQKAAKADAVSAKADSEKLMEQQRSRADDLQQKLDKLKSVLSRKIAKNPAGAPPEMLAIYKGSMDDLLKEKQALQDQIEDQRRDAEKTEKVIAEYKQDEIRRDVAESITPQSFSGTDAGSVVAYGAKGILALGFNGLAAPRRGDLYHAKRAGRVVGKATVGNIYRTIVVFEVKPGVANKFIEVGDTVQRIEK